MDHGLKHIPLYVQKRVVAMGMHYNPALVRDKLLGAPASVKRVYCFMLVTRDLTGRCLNFIPVFLYMMADYSSNFFLPFLMSYSEPIQLYENLMFPYYRLLIWRRRKTIVIYLT